MWISHLNYKDQSLETRLMRCKKTPRKIVIVSCEKRVVPSILKINTRFTGQPNEGTYSLYCEPDDVFLKIPKIIQKFLEYEEGQRVQRFQKEYSDKL